MKITKNHIEEDFEWDVEKAERNLKEKGVSFEYARNIFYNEVIHGVDTRFDYSEIRYIAMGPIEGRIYVVVYTWRDGRRRIISARKANHREVRQYEEDKR